MDSEPTTAVHHLLESLTRGDRQAAADLLPLVYDELRRLAGSRLARTPPGQTLQPTALVHEAYLKLVGNHDPGWEGRAHFFGAAARAMREILVDEARRKAAVKRGGNRQRLDAVDIGPSIAAPREDLLALDESIRRLEQEDPRKGEIIMLRYFAGLSREETAAALGLTVRTIDREWRYIVARLHMELADPDRRGETDR